MLLAEGSSALDVLTLVVACLAVIVSAAAVVAAERGHRAAERSAKAAEDSVKESRRAAAAAERAAATGEMEFEHDRSQERVKAQAAANELVVKRADSDHDTLRFRTPGSKVRAGLLLTNGSDSDFTDLELTFENGALPLNMLAAHSDQFVEPPGDPIPAGADVGTWTLTFRDLPGRRWRRSSEDIHGPAQEV